MTLRTEVVPPLRTDDAPVIADDACACPAVARRAAGIARLLPALALAGWLAPAAAHHPIGGATPQTWVQGVLSGIGHPVIGLDHLAFLLAAGLLAACLRTVPAARVAGLAVAFAGAGAIGTLLRVFQPGSAWTEVLVAVSVVAVGLSLLRRAAPGVATLAATAVLAGLAHGHAFGEAIVGAESTPLLGYLGGLFVTQLALLGAAFATGRAMVRASPERAAWSMRTAGAAVAGIGVFALAGGVASALAG